jgi:hypothetical protein
MTPLLIDATETTPSVLFDNNKGIMDIKGNSYDEDSTEFFRRLIGWLQDYRLSPNQSIILNLQLKYLNSSSRYNLYETLKLFKAIKDQGIHLTVNWFYEKEDADIREAGEEFSDLINFPFNIRAL